MLKCMCQVEPPLPNRHIGVLKTPAKINEMCEIALKAPTRTTVCPQGISGGSAAYGRQGCGVSAALKKKKKIAGQLEGNNSLQTAMISRSMLNPCPPYRKSEILATLFHHSLHTVWLFARKSSSFSVNSGTHRASSTATFSTCGRRRATTQQV